MITAVTQETTSRHIGTEQIKNLEPTNRFDTLRSQHPRVIEQAVMPLSELLNLGSGASSADFSDRRKEFAELIRRFLANPLTETPRLFPLDVRDLSAVPLFQAKFQAGDSLDEAISAINREEVVTNIVRETAISGEPYLAVWEDGAEATCADKRIKINGKSLRLRIDDNVISVYDGHDLIGNGGILVKKQIEGVTAFAALVSIITPSLENLVYVRARNEGIGVTNTSIKFELPEKGADVHEAVDRFIERLSKDTPPDSVNIDVLFTEQAGLTDKQRDTLVQWLANFSDSTDNSVRYVFAFKAMRIGPAALPLAATLRNNLAQDQNGQLYNDLLARTSIEALGSIRDSESVGILTDYVLHGEQTSACDAASSLGHLGKNAIVAVPAAVILLEEETSAYVGIRSGNRELHLSLMRMLANLEQSSSEAIPVLTKKLVDSLHNKDYRSLPSENDYILGSHAALALATVADADSKQVVASNLVTALRIAHDLYTSTDRLAGAKCVAALSLALGNLGVGSPEVKALLTKVSQDTFLDNITRGVTAAARSALAKFP